jgi:hypothetical protein
MRDVRAEPVPASIFDLCEALKPWFQPLVAEAFGKGRDGYIGNAYWMEAAASVWLALRDGKRVDDARR